MKVNKKTIKIILLELLGIALLWLFVNSSYTNFIPKCWIYEKTGLLCLACGGTRCIKYLMQGNLIASFQSHAVFFIGIIYLLILNILYLINLNKAKKIGTKLYPRYWHAIIFVVLLIGYTIIRNLL